MFFTIAGRVLKLSFTTEKIIKEGDCRSIIGVSLAPPPRQGVNQRRRTVDILSASVSMVWALIVALINHVTVSAAVMLDNMRGAAHSIISLLLVVTCKSGPLSCMCHANHGFSVRHVMHNSRAAYLSTTSRFGEIHFRFYGFY